MPNIPVRVQQTIFASSGLPEDNIVNTVHYQIDSTLVSTTNLHAMAGEVAQAFTLADGGGHTIGYYMGTTVSRTAHPEVATYLLDADGRSGSPETVDYWPGTLAARSASDNDLPREVALCLSLHGDLAGIAEDVPGGPAGPAGDTHPRARVRGRLFIGPWNLDAGGLRPGASVRTLLQNIGTALIANNGHSTAEYLPAIYSRKNRATVPMTGGWVDDEWDIQRRRGTQRTTRTLFGSGLG